MATEDKTQEPSPSSKSEESQPSLKDEDQQKKGILSRIGSLDMKPRDWIQLLIIPLILATTGFLFNDFEQTRSQVASQQQSLQQVEASLVTALD